MSFDKGILRKYAQLEEPEKLPPSVYFTHTEHTITIFDAYPKATFHFLVLPRVKDKTGPWSAANLISLKKFFNSNQASVEDARILMQRLKGDAETVCEMIVEEMRSRYGFVWKLYMGFHAVQSMDHVHLHIFSEDLCARALKTKKHYNSFHPKLGFFLHLDDVLSWFDKGNAESYIKSMTKLEESSYEKKLKEPLECFHCAKELRNIPTLKEHLKQHFDKIAEKGKATEANGKRGCNERRTEEKTKGSKDHDLKQETEMAQKAVSPDSAGEVAQEVEDRDYDAPRKRLKLA
ncbi:uncharacterized protein FOMMEDRAFT_109677 [Fomitiporia mediterranea MF3/22]|uniref:uncharacterized protein n=1 Tax=Fomitiporia mediterranea (strain MF3/22) TaxID=694068 RepID=UPI0004407886|nr:uncharacterized protein FOMMEDRAFT_109677 [Fomitiporia mediterranea MF3/22]EJD02366.1 hypothetical protein FOMMEDRAFT_109677 [Fomitiporia mediterranea MF3/22]